MCLGKKDKIKPGDWHEKQVSWHLYSCQKHSANVAPSFLAVKAERNVIRYVILVVYEIKVNCFLRGNTFLCPRVGNFFYGACIVLTWPSRTGTHCILYPRTSGERERG